MVGSNPWGGVTVRRQGAATLGRVRPAPADQAKGRNMGQSQTGQLRKMVRSLAKAGLPFDVAVLLIAARMRADGIPITEANLDAAFA
jgi:hypothetical protein